ncbi:MAG: FimB/Mfa2 family fimbrial subunit, partial [Alistipes sp.]|nr:FimB/Mfa2 family fimbrial subunit [Alistipes sp.]
VRLYSAHHKVTVTVKGYIGEEIMGQSAMASTGDLELRLTDVSSECDFCLDDPTQRDQNLAMGDLVEYNPTLTLDKESGWYEGKFNILRHTADSTMAFEIIERATGRVLFTVTFADFLKEFYEVDITKQEALIPMIVEFTDEVIVTIPSWMLEHRDPIYDKNY